MKVVQSVEVEEKLTAVDSSTTFDCALVHLMEKMKEGGTRERGRWMEMSISTLYGRKRQEEEKKKCRRAVRNEDGSWTLAGRSCAE